MKDKLKIVVIYSNARKQSTYHFVQMFKTALQNESDADFIEFTLPHDMEHICLGCFTCFEQGEEKCPHASSVQPIINAMLASDGIILSSPVYALDASCAMKSLLDHMCYLWIIHRPRKEMFDKTVMAISTTAGAGVKTSLKTLKKSPRYWGIKRIYSFGIRLGANRWNQVSEQTRHKVKAKLTKKAKQFHKSIINRDKLNTRLFSKFMFSLMGNMIGGYEAGGILHKDQEYWKHNGWLDGKKPWKE